MAKIEITFHLDTREKGVIAFLDDPQVYADGDTYEEALVNLRAKACLAMNKRLDQLDSLLSEAKKSQ